MVVQVPRRLRGGAADLGALRLAAQRLCLAMERWLQCDHCKDSAYSIVRT